ncbi:hypothetical protein JCM31826_19590 [Thermaurantimonas aggregans]|uniref:Uncharacterized protein n=1 Tax=Thermaurantimonas aggregans TaxID=2173829 RepID=A0A401XN80_9FLAO|nr:tetratricopeptide repeat protein [Thermaurantimonas aggregans]MCX8148493.1 tetratricopeptide repeat protein [Thermaurantimonas aggregans]GCD78477.1 hypothetical protein JCM31826_19590 [Thermaurantimonas aggregans]
MAKKNLLISFTVVLLASALLYLAPRYPATEKTSSDNQNQASTKTDSLDAIVDQALVNLQKGEGSPMESIMAIRRVLETDPNHLKANFTLGALSFSTGQYDRAVERMNKVLEIAPDTEEAYKILADALHKSGKSDSAETVIKTYLAKFPEGQFVQDFKNF